MIEYNHIAGQSVSRIEALSDGVFAIAMTLLVFDLKEPVDAIINSNAGLLQALGEMMPRFLTYFLSFMTMGIFWTGQSTQFSYIQKYNRDLNWYSLFFLLFITLLPFTTGILSKHITLQVAVGLYWLNIAALGFLLLRHWDCAAQHGYLNLADGKKNEVYKVVRRRIIVAQSLYAGGALLCFFSTYTSILVIIGIQLHYAFAIFAKRTNR